MVAGVCLWAPLPLKTNSPATLCQFTDVPEILFLTPKSTILYEVQITAAGLSRQLGRFPVTFQLTLLLSVQEGCAGLEPSHMVSGQPASLRNSGSLLTRLAKGRERQCMSGHVLF